MKRTAVLFAAGVAALLFSGPAFAADKTGTGTSGTGSYSSGSTGATAPAEKPGVTSMPHHVTGSVVSVDKKSNSVSIKDTKGKEMTLVADTDTAAQLSRLKEGDEVKATYKKDKEQMVLTKIEIARARSSSTTK